MRRLEWLVIGLALVLSLGLAIHNSGNVQLPGISEAHAASVSISLTGCVVTGGACLNVGWNGTTTKQNPPITVTQGDVISIPLSSADGFSHEFQLDVDNDNGEMSDCGVTDPCSLAFPPSTTFTFTVSAVPKAYNYFCVFHTLQMKGTFTVNPSQSVGGTTSPVSPMLSVQSIAIASILIVAISVATVYVVLSKRKSQAG